MKNILLENGFVENVSMSDYTTFGIGGNADFFKMPSTKEEFINDLKIARETGLDVLVIGNGSNLLVVDSGYRGIVICTKGVKDISVDGEKIIASAGALMSTVASVAERNSLTGLEFASGIPGTIGGGVFMNAGAYNGEMSFVVERVEAIDENGEIKTFTKEESKFGKRHSVFQEKSLIILEVELLLKKGDKRQIEDMTIDFNLKRTTKQPLSYPSAGSTFKRPEGNYAGKLIEDAGLKGLQYRNAEISGMHAGFIINTGGATADDVRTLIAIAKKAVYDKFEVELELEVRIIGSED